MFFFKKAKLIRIEYEIFHIIKVNNIYVNMKLQLCLALYISVAVH